MVSNSAPATHRIRLSQFSGKGYDKGRSKFAQALWFATQNLVFGAWWLPPRARPPLLRLFGATIGKNVFIRHRVRVLWPWKLAIGDESWIGEGAWLLNLERIDIGRDVCISQEAFLCTGSHRFSDTNFDYDNAPITVGDGTWIATQALLLRGVTVGRDCLVGARAIVHESLADGSRVMMSEPND